uniref:Uncharacterized protein n=1 Tax=Sinorhizobium fredii (strain NBRC 101917 / NGR234) TaxID=394 RepID=Q6W1C2_SINFN|nr:Hypothetical protein RNGR00321 [Sinorhizobium fredii NGR234]
MKVAFGSKRVVFTSSVRLVARMFTFWAQKIA